MTTLSVYFGRPSFDLSSHYTGRSLHKKTERLFKQEACTVHENYQMERKVYAFEWMASLIHNYDKTYRI
jgi:hypothetical protein